MSLNLDYGDYVTIIYASLQSFGILSTSFYVLFKSSSSGCMEKLKEIWSYKWIYFSSLSTIYDQATDIGVLIYWHSLINNDKIEHVDMELLFVLSCIFLSISRFVSGMYVFAIMKSVLLGLFLGMFDLLIMTLVWVKISENKNTLEELRQDEDELSIILGLQMYETYFETLPQILLQSLFLIRTFKNDVVYDTNNQFNIYLVWISLFISVVSSTNKISSYGTSGGISTRDSILFKLNIRKKCPIINIYLLSLKMYFILTILTRLFIYSLLWSICGGMVVTLFFVTCFVVHVVCLKKGVYTLEDLGLRDGNDSIYHVSLAFFTWEAFGFLGKFNHESTTLKRFVISNTLSLIGLLLVLYFGIDNSFDCIANLCANKKIRSLKYNTFAFVIFCIIIGTFIVQCGLWLLIPKFFQLSTKWEINYQSKKQMKKTSNDNTKNKSSVDTMVEIPATSPM